MERDRAHPTLALVISRPGLPLTESIHLWYDPFLTPPLSLAHRCFHVTSDFAHSRLQFPWYRTVIGWGPAMTQSGQNMNHVGQSISLYPVTSKRSSVSEFIRMVFFWGVTTALKLYSDAIMIASLISCGALSCCCWLGTIFSKWHERKRKTC